MRIVGFDTATRKCGWAVLEGEKLLGSGVFKLPGAKSLDGRLRTLWYLLEELGAEYDPELVAMETPWVHRRHRLDTAIRLGQAVGVIRAWAYHHGLPVTEIHHATAKKALTGSGRATKHGVQQAVECRFDILAREDEADAVAVAWAALAINDWEGKDEG